MNYMISMFIDDELDLTEKIEFIEKIQNNNSFADETMTLLHQEKVLRQDVVDRVPPVEMKTYFNWKRLISRFFQPMGIAASVAAAVIIFFVFFMPKSSRDMLNYRFVIYRPEVNQVEITGSFTDWKRIPLHKIGDSGYWEIFLAIRQGEHRFTYILEGQRSYADPTIPARETDDFGGQNSVLNVEQKA